MNRSSLKKILGLTAILLIVAGVALLPHISFADITTDAIVNAVDTATQKTLGYIAYFFLKSAALLVSLCGLVFNYVMDYTVVHMKERVTSIDSINKAWTMLRDIGNILFIFILVYVAIKTILGLSDGNTKRMIRNVIIVGLLVNFSLFFTKFLIDISNVFSILFYNIISGGNGADGGGIANTFARSLGIQSVFNPSKNGFLQAFGEGSVHTYEMIAIVGIGGTIFLSVVALTFLIAAILFALRFALLIILMILSPLAFFAAILPNTQIYARKWWNALSSQLIFAPMYMALILIVALIAQKTSVIDAADPQSGLANAMVGVLPTSVNQAHPGAIGSIFFFVLIIIFMNAATMIALQQATKIGGKAAGFINKATGVASTAFGRIVRAPVTLPAGATAAALRSSIGARANSIVNDEDNELGNKLKRQAATGNIVTRNYAKARLALNEKASNASFNVINAPGIKQGAAKLGITATTAGYRERFEKNVKAQEEAMIADARSRGGASEATLAKISENKNIVKTAEQNLQNIEVELASATGDRKTELETQQYKWEESRRVAQADLDKAVKDREREIKVQHLQFAKTKASAWYNGPRRQFSAAHRAATKKALAKLQQSVRPVNSDPKKAKTESINNILRDAIKRKDVAKIKEILGSPDMTKQQFKALDPNLFVEIKDLYEMEGDKFKRDEFMNKKRVKEIDENGIEREKKEIIVKKEVLESLTDDQKKWLKEANLGRERKDVLTKELGWNNQQNNRGNNQGGGNQGATPIITGPSTEKSKEEEPTPIPDSEFKTISEDEDKKPSKAATASTASNPSLDRIKGIAAAAKDATRNPNDVRRLLGAYQLERHTSGGMTAEEQTIVAEIEKTLLNRQTPNT